MDLHVDKNCSETRVFERLCGGCVRKLLGFACARFEAPKATNEHGNARLGVGLTAANMRRGGSAANRKMKRNEKFVPHILSHHGSTLQHAWSEREATSVLDFGRVVSRRSDGFRGYF
jgi:hypothetical protein